MPRTTASAGYNQVVGARLRARRLELGLTQADLARRLEVSNTYVQNVEAGRANLTLGQLARIAAGLQAYPEIRLEPLGELEAPRLTLPGVTILERDPT
jgi:transcriptional regulator with XRE-family HTH domain